MPTEEGAKQFLSAFSDPKAIAQYADGARRFVPVLRFLTSIGDSFIAALI